MPIQIAATAVKEGGRIMHCYGLNGYICKDENINIYKYIAKENEAKHTHAFIEIVYILSGKGKHSVNDMWYPVERGNLLFINFGQTHSFCSVDNMEIVNCLIQPEFIDKELIHSENAFEMLVLSAFEDFNLDSDKLIPRLLFKGKDMIEIEMLIDSMLDEFAAKRTNYKTVLKGYLLVFLTKIFREMQNTDSANILKQMNRITPDILKYIEDNCFEKITLKELAQKCFYSPSYFSHMFKNYYGKTLTEFINEKRIQEAARLLQETNYSIEEVSLRVGYQDRKQFYKVFKEHMGVTPSTLRRASNSL